MSKKTIYILIGGAVVIIASLIILSKTGVIGNKDKGTEVEIAQVIPTTIVETVSATGKIQPEIEVKISSEVSGEIISLNVKEGQVVKKGDLLVKINPDLYTSGYNRSVSNLSGTRANLSQADASFKESKSNYDRNKTLFEKGIISKSDWDKATASYEVAKAAKQTAYFNVQSASATVNEAKDNLGRTTIYAPADGTISMLNVELGERVLGTQQMTGTEILRVANLNNMEVEVDVNENDIVKIKVGDEANVEVDAYLKKQFKGIVTSISNSASSALTADQVTNFKVKIRILKESYQDLLEGKPEAYSPFRPGMTATVDIITQTKSNVLSVPISSVVIKSDTAAVKEIKVVDLNEEQKGAAPKSDKKFECVFVKVGDKAKIRIIKTGIQDDANIEVLTGLKKGDVVITGPYSTVTKDLNSGDKVAVKTDKEKGESKK
ncbi:MAG TPA: efflux RND transporter periplasmic adaptor subunit [Flavobacterium sp.]|jgi:HlyD family secretion protein|uniref:efflux RND transporter periplasmic adaptor subunit n=1 Tax=Flavobacterium sp. TaxID=239 RepID=UPI001B43F96C|nr:efflux RND transporter periplasmic adaptor subunit [Flavobacterium sp.]MBP7182198.1 efflux RND transporter periplasmic adaptor subunit [Flavobacterium sp.]MBP7317435.1 efflux RND transporter periplasmic adaptor subunit [Flavobacterium sp.]MBP8885979.1 efflux RND transporter periplasmic adaptor subunit [Flavobacterium sp.]HRL72294.1 efflux RND transporter periplasmic adaptor subunit [Flavobacterium sp.]HRM11525.1 efflux RND transporter periplasmic adaptor subunit [Flavobacterium sp.]